MKIAILCSGVALGVYIPGLYLCGRLREKGTCANVFVLENLFLDEKKAESARIKPPFTTISRWRL